MNDQKAGVLGKSCGAPLSAFLREMADHNIELPVPAVARHKTMFLHNDPKVPLVGNSRRISVVAAIETHFPHDQDDTPAPSGE